MNKLCFRWKLAVKLQLVWVDSFEPIANLHNLGLEWEETIYFHCGTAIYLLNIWLWTPMFCIFTRVCLKNQPWNNAWIILIIFVNKYYMEIDTYVYIQVDLIFASISHISFCAVEGTVYHVVETYDILYKVYLYK